MHHTLNCDIEVCGSINDVAALTPRLAKHHNMITWTTLGTTDAWVKDLKYQTLQENAREDDYSQEVTVRKKKKGMTTLSFV